MPLRTVRNALVRYPHPDLKDVEEVAFRGDVVDFPADWIEKHEAELLPEGETELQLRGEPYPIAGDASREELIFWMMGTTTREQADFIADQSEEYPDIQERMDEARSEIIDTRVATPRAKDGALEAPGLPEDVTLTVNREGLSTITAASDAPDYNRVEVVTPETGDDVIVRNGETNQDPEADEASYDELIAMSATRVVNYIRRNPDEVDAVEQYEAEREGGPRATVTRAIEAVRNATPDE